MDICSRLSGSKTRPARPVRRLKEPKHRYMEISTKGGTGKEGKRQLDLRDIQ